jgi:type II secretory pathway pseudopilin PulG
MKNTNCEGFTLMEAIVSIAIIITISGCIIIALTSGTKANYKSLNAVRTANLILETDRYIREQTDSLHIPYWLKPDESIEAFKNELLRSKIGKQIKTIIIMYDNSIPRGITVEYTAGAKLITTSALFPFIPVKDAR